MKRAILVVSLLIMSTAISLSINNIEGTQEEGISIMNLLATDDERLTPYLVNESTMEFTRDDDIWNSLPMRPFQWYTIGEWELPYIDHYMNSINLEDISGKTTIWITLSCPENITMDLSGSFKINFNPAVDPAIFRNVSIGPEPRTFTIEFDTEGISLEDTSLISMRWSMRGGSDDIIIHIGNDDGTGMITFINPLVVQSVDYIGGIGVSIDLYKPFESWDSWDFHFLISLDGGPLTETEHFYFISGGDEHYYIGIDETDITYGEHTFRWEADYGYSSHSSGSHEFVIEEEEPEENPVDDDQQDPINPSDDDEPNDEPDFSKIDINVNICNYKIFKDENFVSCEIQVEGTTSGCYQIVITANEYTEYIERDISWRIDSYDTDGNFRYDGTGLEYHIKQFEDLSNECDWSEFKLHVKYTVDLEYFKDLWSMDISPDNFPDVGDKMLIMVGAVEDPNDTESDMGLWSKNITAQQGSDPRAITLEVGNDDLGNDERNQIDTGIILTVMIGIVVILIIGLVVFFYTKKVNGQSSEAYLCFSSNFC